MTYINGPVAVKNGLVMYLDAGNRKSYPGSGTTWFDLSGNNNHGTMVNTPTFDGANGGSIVFNGSNQYVSRTNTTTLTFTANQSNTFEYVISHGDPNALTNGGLVSKANFSNQYAHLSYSNTINIYQEQTDTTTTYSPSNLLLNRTNVWTHITVVYVNSIIYVYRDGELFGQSASGKIFNANSNTLYIGSNAATNYFYLGKMALFRIYNRGLTSTEVIQNFNATRGRFGV